MKTFRKITVSVLLASALSAWIPTVPVHAEEPLAFRISKVEILPDSIGDNRLLSVDLCIEGNEKGFLAAEFGIAYDLRLTLQSVQSCCEAADCFTFSSTSENHMIWFSGANVKAANGATSGKTKMFTMDFILPENCQIGDVFAIGYEWDGVDGASGFWYTAKEVDELTSLMSYSRVGTVSIPSPDAPKLNKSSVTMNQNSTFALSLQNSSDEGIWFSDNDAVATVENGVITAHSPGSCTISVFLGDASSLLTCDVLVRSDYCYSMFETDPIVITSKDAVVCLEYPNAVGSVTWISTNPNVIMVDDGKLTVKADGTAQIIASNNGISKLKTISVRTNEQQTTTDVPESQKVTESRETTKTEKVKCGDLNGDDAVDILDVIIINKYLVGSTDLQLDKLDAADVVRDGEINSRDSLNLLKYALGMFKEIPLNP